MNKTCRNLIDAFKNPHTDYGPVVMWFWNDYITKDGITFQLEKFREENITEFFIHPAIGFAVEYLSDHYMELIQFVVQEAKRLGMHYWIYDEYEYPSGTAGGILLGKVMYLVTGGKVNPLIGSAGVSAVPMAARVSQKVGQQYDPGNFLLMHAMGPNVAGVIGSAVAAGVLLNLFG